MTIESHDFKIPEMADHPSSYVNNGYVKKSYTVIEILNGLSAHKDTEILSTMIIEKKKQIKKYKATITALYAALEEYEHKNQRQKKHSFPETKKDIGQLVATIQILESLNTSPLILEYLQDEFIKATMEESFFEQVKKWWS